MTKIIDTITRSKKIPEMHIYFLQTVEELKTKVIKAAQKNYDESKYKFLTYASWRKSEEGIKVKMECNVVEVGK